MGITIVKVLVKRSWTVVEKRPANRRSGDEKFPFSSPSVL